MITPKLTSEEIHNGSLLIAEFMGLKLFTEYTPAKEDWWAPHEKTVMTYNGTWCSTTPPPFNISWDWTMPIIDKINNLGKEYSFAIFKTYVSLTVEKGGKMYKDFSFAYSEYITAEQSGIEAAFKLVVKFIKWYNENIVVKNLVDSN